MNQFSTLEISSKNGAFLTDVEQFQVYTTRHLDSIPQVQRLPEAQRREMRAVAQVLPFRVNRYVIDELIDWDNVPHDPIFQLTFPQRGMLAPEDFERIAALLDAEAEPAQLQAAVQEIRQKLNPHPAGQQLLNVPRLDDKRLEGMQHKYRETVLFFPSQGQTCHAYCSFCFRWAQFIGDKELRISAHEASLLHRYLKQHHEVTDLLVTGGDPMVMKSKHMSHYLFPLLGKE